MSIEVRLMKREESHLANNFFNSIYKTDRSQKDFNWEFMEAPAGPAIYVIAIDTTINNNIKIVGIQCAIPIRLQDVQGNTVLSAKSEDTLVDPAYRGQKIFERMYDLLFIECEKAGIKFIWGFTPAKKAFERIGFEIPFEAHQALQVFRPIKSFSYLSKLNTANKISDKLKIAALSVMSWLGSLIRGRGKGKLVMVSVPIEAKHHIATTFSHAEPYYFLDMSEAYLRWRLELNPFGNSYQSYQFFDNNKLVADAIVNRRASVAYIEQVVFDAAASFETRKQIVNAIVDTMKDAPMIRVLCFDINRELKDQEALLKACGFVVLHRGAHFVWKSFVGEAIDPRMIFLSRLFTQGNQ